MKFLNSNLKESDYETFSTVEKELNSQKNKKAFSMIEFSIVLLIIGIIFGSVIAGNKLVRISNLTKARTLTNSAPVAGAENLALWLETTSKNSFPVTTPNDASFISTWNDINPQQTVRNNATQPGATSLQPTYVANGINGLPTLNFDGSDYLAGNVFLSGNSITIFIVAKRAAIVNNTSTVVIYNPTLATGDNISVSSSTVSWEAGGGVLQSYRNTVGESAATHPGNGVAYIFANKYDGTNNTVYLNGVAQTPVASSGLFATSNYAVGARYETAALGTFYNGNIGEVIMFNRALSDAERKDIENYLSKKWGIKLS